MLGERVTSSVTCIRPPSRWVALDVRELVAFRELAWRLVRRDITVRYRQTILGVVWVVLQPLLTAGVFTLVFNRVAGVQGSDQVPYFLLAFWGATCFTAFSQSLLRSAQSLIANSPLVEKVYFPRLLLPLSATGSVALDTVVSVLLGLGLTLSSGVIPDRSFLLLPLWLLLSGLLGLAGGLLCAPLIVRYRDVGYVVPLLTQLLLYVSPVGYTASTVPADLQTLFQANPLAPLLEATRWAALGTPAPTSTPLLAALLVTTVALVAGAFWFRGQERSFADVL